jgi:hypothetical protein
MVVLYDRREHRCASSWVRTGIPHFHVGVYLRINDRLLQKHLLQGAREVETLDDSVRIITKPTFKNSWLEFPKKVKCGPMSLLYPNMPYPSSFDASVDAWGKTGTDYLAFTWPND